MADRDLTMMTRTSGVNGALIQDTVRPRGYTLRKVEVPSLVMGFRRMVRTLAFDVCEMALTTYLCARQHGVAFTALPIFLVRGLHHGGFVIADPRFGAYPKGLHGQRVAVNRGYTVTTGVWARGIVARERGLDLRAITWVPTSDEHVESYQRPRNVTEPSASSITEMLARKNVVAAVGSVTGLPDSEPIIPDPYARALDDLQQTGFYPINHLVVVRDALLKSEPKLALRLFEAFVESKQFYLEALHGRDSAGEVDPLHVDVVKATGWEDPLPYGIAPNRQMLETLASYGTEQGILSPVRNVEELFAESTRDLVG